MGVAAVLCAFVLVKYSDSNLTVPTDVPKVLIQTGEEITRDGYVGCTVCVIDEKDGEFETIVDEGSKIKIRGNSTSTGAKSPYNIKFSSKTDVLGMGENKKWCLLANCFDPTLLRNLLVFDFSDEIGVPYTPDYRVVDVYVNTEFRGSYLLTDAVQVSLTRVDIDLSNNEFLLEIDYRGKDEDMLFFYSPIYQIRFGVNEPEIDELTEEQMTYLATFIEQVEEALQSGDEERIAEYIDIDSFINFYIVNELFKSVDVAFSSTRFHIKDGKIYGGPIWDFDLSSGNGEFNYYDLYNNASSSGNSWEGLWTTLVPWFEQLLANDVYKQKMYSRYLELQDVIVNLYEDNTVGVNRIDYNLKKYKGTINRNYGKAGWEAGYTYSSYERERDSTYEDNVEYLRDWLRKRNEWLLDEWNLHSLVSVE